MINSLKYFVLDLKNQYYKEDLDRQLHLISNNRNQNPNDETQIKISTFLYKIENIKQLEDYIFTRIDSFNIDKIKKISKLVNLIEKILIQSNTETLILIISKSSIKLKLLKWKSKLNDINKELNNCNWSLIEKKVNQIITLFNDLRFLDECRISNYVNIKKYLVTYNEDKEYQKNIDNNNQTIEPIYDKFLNNNIKSTMNREKKFKDVIISNSPSNHKISPIKRLLDDNKKVTEIENIKKYGNQKQDYVEETQEFLI